MALSQRITFALLSLTLCFFSKHASAQLWRYLDDSPKKERVAELAVKREASSVKTVSMVAYSDTLRYEIIDYNIQTLDGLDDSIRMYYTPFTGQFTIKSSNDSLRIYDYSSTDSVHFLNKNFLELIYSPRGGSDDGYQNTMILYVNKGRIGVAMEIETDHQFDFPKGWGEYCATVKLKSENQSNYKLIVKTNDRLYSKVKHTKNHNLNNQFILKYDLGENVFYNESRMINGWFSTLGYSADKLKAKTYFHGSYPMIKLDSFEYYYVNGLWCSVGKNTIISDYDRLKIVSSRK